MPEEFQNGSSDFSCSETDHPNQQNQQERKTLDRGATLGRYVIIEPIGAGGMGQVYRAYDPLLNRGIALKILSVKHHDTQVEEKAKTRLLREAQALAQLSHPNVVEVYDVGIVENEIFIAMALVEGRTLQDWIQEKKHTRSEILDVMLAAGRGLFAAHKADITHRDFKPSNVMVGDDGRVRVLDFGLARGTNEDPAQVANTNINDLDVVSNDPSTHSQPNLLLSPLTQTRGIVGTPLYMSPEQHLNLKVDERSDQFSYCLVLYWVFYGQRPFSGRTPREISKNILQQQVSAPPHNTDVPATLRAIVLRGLAKDPADRYPSMQELLDLLGQSVEKPTARYRILLVISFILLTIILPVGVWYGLRYRTVQLCKAAQSEFAGVWDNNTKKAVRSAFLETQKTFAESTWVRVEQNLDKYVADWKQMRSDVCEARWIRGTQSEELFDLRMGCLEKRTGELGALTSVFTQANAKVVVKALQASTSLTSISVCAEADSLRAKYPPPKTPEAKTRVAAIRKGLTKVQAFRTTGKYQEGLTLAQTLVEQANQVAYQPVQAETSYWLGELLYCTGQYKSAETTLYQAARSASESADGLLAAKVINRLIVVVGYSQARHAEGIMLGRMAEVVLGLSPKDDPVRAKHYNNLGIVFSSQSQFTQALDSFRKALVLSEKALGADNPYTALLLNNIGVMFQDRGDYDKALVYHRRALAIKEKTLGPEHPSLSASLSNMGEVFSRLGKLDQALAYHTRALELRKKTLGADHPEVAKSLNNLSEVLFKRKEYKKAFEYNSRALKIAEQALGREHPLLATLLSNLGAAYLVQNKPTQAIKPLKRAISICEKTTCEMEPDASSHFSLAQALIATNNEVTPALKLAQQASEIYSQNAKRFQKEIEEVNLWVRQHQP